MTPPPADAGDADEFELFELRVEVVGPRDRTIYCGAKLGDSFEHGEMLKFTASLHRSHGG